MDMEKFIRKIWTLRDEDGIPIYFRRNWLDNGKVIWYIWYGHTQIAYRATQDRAQHVVRIAALVHEEAKRA